MAAWDSKSSLTRRRGDSISSNSKSIPFHNRQQSKAVTVAQPKSAHVSDPFLADFLNGSFDPADYWNSTLSSLQPSVNSLSSAKSASAASLPELSSQAQETITQLNAHTTRLTNVLTQLTDDILRSGSRLAYEVELLRGETLSLAEALSDGLQDDVSRFYPGGLREGAEKKDASALPPPESPALHQRRASTVFASADAVAAAATDGTPSDTPEGDTKDESAISSVPSEPAYITQLRTLALVRSRLDSVIKTFGDAMEFVFPPSELSVSSSFLSVSAPEPGADAASTEEKGQQVLRKLRDEVAALLATPSLGAGADRAIAGVEAAARRIEELKELSRVWRGTAEEKGRARFVEGLAKMVEDRHRELLREAEQTKGRTGAGGGDVGARKGNGDEGGDAKGYSGGYGLITQLQKIRSGL